MVLGFKPTTSVLTKLTRSWLTTSLYDLMMSQLFMTRPTFRNKKKFKVAKIIDAKLAIIPQI
jgi:hypothetical protein